MPWTRTDPVQERALFVGAVNQDRASFSSVCATFGVSRRTGYKWWNLFQREGVKGLEDRSRRPLRNNRAIDPKLADRFEALRREHPTWGPRKLVGWFELNEPGESYPAASTVGALLKRRGLVKSPPEFGRRWRDIPRTAPLRHATSSNLVWSMDFKGWFRLGDRTRCDPFTLTDNFSRYLLCCQANGNQLHSTVWKALSKAFREFGMPEAIRFDNGQPWSAPCGSLHLTTLSSKILRLGIELERIGRGKPQENGRHERFHLTLQNETTRPPARTLAAQQRRFLAFRKEYNEDRPHEALGQRPPATVYRCSDRRFPSKLPEPEYPSGCTKHRVATTGRIRFEGQEYFVSTALDGQYVGLFEIEEGCYEVWYCSEPLGRLHREHPKLGLILQPKVLPMSPV